MKVKNILTLILLGNLVFLNGCISKDVNDFAESTLKNSKNVSQEISSNLKNASLNDSQKYQLKVNTAIEISNQIKIKNLQSIDLKKVQTLEDYNEMADHLNLAVKIINDKIDSDFKYLQKGTESYDKFMMEITRYSPLIDNYNEFIQSSYNLNSSNECSVNNLYIKGIKFAGETAFIMGGAFYETAYLTTGTLARYLGLAKMSSICGPCVSAAMSGSHWFTRNSLIEKTTGTVETVLTGNCTNQTNKS